MIHFVIVGLLTLASTFGLYTVLTGDGVLPLQASAQAGFIDDLFGWQFLAMSFFYSLVIVFMFYSLIVFRRRKGDDSYGEHFEGNSKLEIAWTAIPLVVVMIFGYLGAETLGNVERRDPGALEINVIAQQWSWRFEYPESGVVSDTLVIPEDRQILLKMRSEDVIHSFWVPEFRVKQDILPGGDDFVKELRITPTERGTYKVRCAELCGQSHYDMRADVVVVSNDQYESWLLENSGACETDIECGQVLAANFGCGSCHQTSDDNTAILGPSWLGLFGSTVPLSDGSQVTVDTDFLYESITDPNAKIHDGFLANVMPPNFSEQLTEEQISQIIAFIESLQ